VRAAALAALLLLEGCSSAPAQPSGPCADRSGSYLYTLDARSGDCGQHSENLIVVDSKSASAPSGCQNESSTSSDNCHVTVDLTGCPDDAAAKGDTADFKGTVTWSHDGASGSGVVDLTVYFPSGQIACHGTFDARYQRQ
jgi:hypothetical protein